jgi:hyperosmotically inducible periplasmic protein
MLKTLAALVASASLVMAVGCAKTDAGITTNVKTKLAADDTVKAYQIDVDTSNGVVTLAGNVENSAAKDQAVMLARQTDGVRDVVDHMTVGRTAATSGELDRRTDLDERASNTADNIGDRTTQAGRNAADKTEDFGRSAADKTEDFGRNAADKTGNAASNAGAAITDGAITSAVKTRFLADPTVKGLKIDVDTDNGVVTLSGNVASKGEMDKAMELARSTSGVNRVVSNLHVK